MCLSFDPNFIDKHFRARGGYGKLAFLSLCLCVFLCLNLTPNPNLSNSDLSDSDITTSSPDTTARSGSETSGDTRNSWVEGKAQEASDGYSLEESMPPGYQRFLGKAHPRTGHPEFP